MSESGHIIIIEDHEGNRAAFKRALTRIGFQVDAFEEAEPALEFFRKNRDVMLIITDLMLPGGMDGLGVVKAAKEIDPEVAILMVTAHATVETAVDAMKQGANDYLTKPVNTFELRQRASALVEKRMLSSRVNELESRLGETFGKIVGRSKPMEAMFRQMELVAPHRSNVLIVGESGTGKELVANAIHEHSPRKDEKFLPINCAAIPAEILESELFGHERGSFTGASARKLGKFELAHKGTLFLDEIGELPLEMQVKLLRVLEQREFMRVGGTETIRVDIRLLAATNADLELAVQESRFRSDLYYRLKVVTIKIPPLRDRTGDIPLLANHFLQGFAQENGREGMRLSADAMKALVRAPWEGNVRELRNVIESMVVLAPGEVIGLRDLPPEILVAEDRAGAAVGQEEQPAEAAGSPQDGTAAGIPAGITMEEIERRAILQAIEATGGNRTKAADMLGIGLRTLQRKLKEYKLAGRLED
ncbi:MAG: sigma-54-dependent Fis family transcriptional regulator [Acidobacteria bacterium]|uniref:Sigma-54-dependent Fis family transcriptional regulator n=1 Tax=Candidatus Polarisedimenticola svalbardensis TaxID=2886004 RepID=A0A8J7CCS3_9BACT|nr:sigma-54-dependent Fis family transcriptional regulator [Candidatus Polarisedimenticola svalbardensis]